MVSFVKRESPNAGHVIAAQHCKARGAGVLRARDIPGMLGEALARIDATGIESLGNGEGEIIGGRYEGHAILPLPNLHRALQKYLRARQLHAMIIMEATHGSTNSRALRYYGLGTRGFLGIEEATIDRLIREHEETEPVSQADAPAAPAQAAEAVAASVPQPVPSSEPAPSAAPASVTEPASMPSPAKKEDREQPEDPFPAPAPAKHLARPNSVILDDTDVPASSSARLDDVTEQLAMLDLSQAALGRLLGVAPRTVTRWLREGAGAPGYVSAYLRALMIVNEAGRLDEIVGVRKAVRAHPGSSDSR